MTRRVRTILVVISIVIIFLTGWLIKRNITEISQVKNKNVYIELNDSEVSKKIEQRENFIVYLYREDCKICKRFSPVYSKILEEKGMKSFSVDTEKNPIFLEHELGDLYQGTPAVYFYKAGKLEDYFIGNQPQDVIKDYLSKFEKVLEN